MPDHNASHKAERPVNDSVVPSEIPAWCEEQSSENRGRILAVKSNDLRHCSSELGHVSVIDWRRFTAIESQWVDHGLHDSSL